jgi:hypothetical protein
MSLQQLVDKALTNPAFYNAYTYWTVTRNKQPDIEWLMDQLEQALGRDYVARAARIYIKKRKHKTARGLQE